MAVIVTGTFVLPSGEVATGRVITLRRADRGVVAFGDDAVIPDDITVTADDDGQVLFDILPGNYVGFARTNGNLTATFTLAVPDVAEIDVADIINAASVPDVPASVLPDGMPGQFVSYGLDGEPIAVDLPEGNLPTGVEGQVVGYGPGGVPVAVDAQAGPQGASAYEIAVSEGFVGDEAAWLSSLVGAAGDDGADGLSSYQVAVSQGFIGGESAWLASLVGPAGDDGEQGPVGPSYNYRGESSELIDQSLAALDTFTHSTVVGGLTTSMLLKPKVARVLTLASIADISSIFANYDVMLFAQNGAAGTNGTNGTNGSDGIDGSDGLSAYQIAVQNGFVGNEEQWLASLVGADGEDGAPGTDGQSVTITTVTTQTAFDNATPGPLEIVVRTA